MTNIVDNKTTLTEFDTTTQDQIALGGGASDVSNIVSPEFAAITGAQFADDEVGGLMTALLGTQKLFEVGIDNVEIVSLSTGGITLKINGAGPTSEYLTITGEDYEAALAAVNNGNTDLKDAKAQFAIFDTDTMSKIFIGGGESDAASKVGAEFASIVGGTWIDTHEVDDLLAGLVTGKGWNDAAHGMDGVELISMTSDEFALKFAGDIVLFTGEAAEAAIDGVTGSFIDIKNKLSQVAEFDTDTMTKMWIGGGKSDAEARLGQEFADITGGSYIDLDEVDDLFSAMVTGKGWSGDHDGLGADVDLVGLTDDSFTLALHTTSYITDTIIFRGEAVAAMIDAVQASGGNGVTDFDWALYA